MIVVDASAVVAVIFREPAGEMVAEKIDRFDCMMSPMSLVEVTMALARRLDHAKFVADQYLRESHIKLCAVDAQHAEWAQIAFLTYGKGRHRARLNLGDCFTYAAAKVLNAPLLYIGDDFAFTDIVAA